MGIGRGHISHCGPGGESSLAVGGLFNWFRCIFFYWVRRHGVEIGVVSGRAVCWRADFNLLGILPEFLPFL